VFAAILQKPLVEAIGRAPAPHCGPGLFFKNRKFLPRVAKDGGNEGFEGTPPNQFGALAIGVRATEVLPVQICKIPKEYRTDRAPRALLHVRSV